MSIKNIKERLEGSYRLIRIKRIKFGFYAIEMILAFILGFTMAILRGAKFEPFYFPVDWFAFIVLIMLLIVSVENIYFSGLELRYTKNKSRKYLLARNNMRRSMAIIAVSAFCVVLLFLPLTQEKIVELHMPSSGGIIDYRGISQNASFKCQDELGLTRASTIQINVSDGDNQVTLMLGGTTGLNIWRPESKTGYSYGGLPEHSAMQDIVSVVVENHAGTAINFTYSVTSDVSPLIKTFIPALGLGFIIVQFAAMSIMYPIREAYASSSIYSKKYVPETDSGEYSVTEIKLTKKEKEEDEAILEKELDMELPEPPKPMPAPEAAKCDIEPEMVRSRGSVDDGLIEEPDVQCSHCGEMNSAQSAMCFSCGTALEAREKLAIDPAAYLKKGESFANAGRYDDAISCYDEVLKIDSTNERTLLRKGEALHKLGKWGSAIQYVNTALKVNPNNVQTLVLKARILEERDRMDKSIEIYSQILALDPENSFAKSRMARLSQQFEKVAEESEIESAEKVLEQFMEVPGIGLARATALYEAGYTSFEMLKSVSEEQLSKVKGISKGVAKKIRKGLDTM
jgi:tetratricopeptide (TPR) repeat protein